MRSALAVVGALFICAIDQTAKYFLVHADSTAMTKFGPVKITATINENIAFSLPTANAVMIALIALALIFVTYMYIRVLSRGIITTIAFGMIWGGSLSNIVDRLRYGGVVDFLQIGISPIFNFADLGITIGLLYFFIAFLKKEKQKDVDTTTRPPFIA